MSKKFSENSDKLLDKLLLLWYNIDTKRKGYKVQQMKQFVIHVSEETYNTILTALRYEKFRAEDEETGNVEYLERAIKDVAKNTYVKG